MKCSPDQLFDGEHAVRGRVPPLVGLPNYRGEVCDNQLHFASHLGTRPTLIDQPLCKINTHTNRYSRATFSLVFSGDDIVCQKTPNIAGMPW